MTLVIFGPTATGKTDLAIKLAKKFNGEIISADSRQVYKKLDIGTGKLSKNLTAGHKITKSKEHWTVDGVKIYGFDLRDPGKSFSAAEFIAFAKPKIKNIHKSNKLPIITGGTGFYIKSLISPPETINIKQNQKLRLQLTKLGTINLFKKLQKLDSQKAKSLNNSDKNNPRRLIRAIEVAISIAKKNPGKASNDQYLILGLTANNDYLYAKVDDWLNYRLQNGLVEEVKDLLKKIDPQWLIALGLEYSWITRYINKEISKNVAKDRLKGDIHKLIRTQKNWFHQFPNIKLFDITKTNWRIRLEKTVSLWYTQGK